MSPKAKALMNLYKRGKVAEDGLRRSVADGVITEEEFFLITGQPY